MIETYKTLKQSIKSNLKGYSNEDLAIMYQANMDDDIIAEMYCRNIGYWIRLSKRINCISEEDKASIILEKLYESMLSFDKDKNSSYLAYAYVYIYNAFGGIKTKRKFKGREKEQTFKDLSDYPLFDEIDKQHVVAYFTQEDDTIKTIELKMSIEMDPSLTKSEKKFCKIIIDNPGIPYNEIGKLMNVGSQRVWIIKNNLKKKIKVSLCLS